MILRSVSFSMSFQFDDVSKFPDKSAFSTISTDLDVEIFDRLSCKDKAAYCSTWRRFRPYCQDDDHFKKCRTITLNNSGITFRALFSPDGKSIAATNENTIKIWDVALRNSIKYNPKGECVKKLTGIYDYTKDIAFPLTENSSSLQGQTM